MGIRTVLQKKFQNLFVAVVLNETECVLRCKVIKDGSIQKTFTKTFPLSSPLEALDKALENYLLSLQDEYTFVYISFLLSSLGQGAISGTGNASFSKHHVDMQNVHHVSLFNQWSAYASYIEIKWAKNLFSEVGLDLIYSPFILLSDFVVSQKLKSKPTCYILNCQDFFILAIFEEKHLHFGAFFKTQSDTSFTRSDDVNDWENEQAEEDIVSSDSMPEMVKEEEEREGIEELSELEELGELEDIDDLRSTDSFSDIEDKAIVHFKGMEDIKEEDMNLELYGRDLLVYKYLRSSLEEYYHNPLYQSEFIDEIIIFDGYEISSELIHQLEDELMMDVEIHKVDVGDRMCDIAIAEVFK
ncbi:hypothetical protein [Sulfurospirillum oryzae]|uniref:hypothetical protein n=1 Tax=Sulfurospirillum oryzae TaxID=2976535 RepID=UPI0021E7EC2F|nr:hypothetical protein [Sulfurospirillum oryzae]